MDEVVMLVDGVKWDVDEGVRGGEWGLGGGVGEIR